MPRPPLDHRDRNADLFCSGIQIIRGSFICQKAIQSARSKFTLTLQSNCDEMRRITLPRLTPR
jgi:hypothetical protein